MRRGTTDYLEFGIPYNADEIEAGFVTFTQGGLIILDKDVTDDSVDLADGVIGIPFTQEDTLALPTGNVKIQIRLRLTDGTAPASNEMELTVDDVYKDGVI